MPDSGVEYLILMVLGKLKIEKQAHIVKRSLKI